MRSSQKEIVTITRVIEGEELVSTRHNNSLGIKPVMRCAA